MSFTGRSMRTDVYLCHYGYTARRPAQTFWLQAGAESMSSYDLYAHVKLDNARAGASCAQPSPALMRYKAAMTWTTQAPLRTSAPASAAVSSPRRARSWTS